jgi:hypothetical protein
MQGKKVALTLVKMVSANAARRHRNATNLADCIRQLWRSVERPVQLSTLGGPQGACGVSASVLAALRGFQARPLSPQARPFRLRFEGVEETAPDQARDSRVAALGSDPRRRERRRRHIEPLPAVRKVSTYIRSTRLSAIGKTGACAGRSSASRSCGPLRHSRPRERVNTSTCKAQSKVRDWRI